MNHLMTMDLGDFDEHSKPPVNQEKHDLIGASLNQPTFTCSGKQERDSLRLRYRW